MIIGGQKPCCNCGEHNAAPVEHRVLRNQHGLSGFAAPDPAYKRACPTYLHARKQADHEQEKGQCRGGWKRI